MKRTRKLHGKKLPCSGQDQLKRGSHPTIWRTEIMHWIKEETKPQLTPTIWLTHKQRGLRASNLLKGLSQPDTTCRTIHAWYTHHKLLHGLSLTCFNLGTWEGLIPNLLEGLALNCTLNHHERTVHKYSPFNYLTFLVDSVPSGKGASMQVISI